jgi:hypothetical protein
LLKNSNIALFLGEEVNRMKKIILILGTILIATILISGSAVAASWFIVYVDDSGSVTNINNILGGDDGSHASIGVNVGGGGNLGWAVLNLSDSAPMPPSTTFTVFAAGGATTEEYSINVSQYPNDVVGVWLGNGDDSGDFDFTTPSLQGSAWQFIIIRALTGAQDSIYGPEIDAIGW